MRHVLLRRKKKLLLIDLDGVLVASHDAHTGTGSALFPLHGIDTRDCLTKNDATIAVLTHRHRAEAEQILKLLKIDSTHIVRCYAAQELWACATKYQQTSQAVLKGLQKSLILPLIKEELGYRPEDIAVIDDRMEILSDMSHSGVGLTLLAPFRMSNLHDNVDLITFDIPEALRVFEKWSDDLAPRTAQHINLEERIVKNPVFLPNRGTIIRRNFDHFYLARKFARTLRRLIFQ